MATGTIAEGRKGGASAEQIEAWGYYGLPSSYKASTTTESAKSTARQIGEVRYIIGWAADQMTRLGWIVRIDGSKKWRLTLPGGEVVVSDDEMDDSDEPTHPINASRRVLEAIGWGESAVRLIATNLYVAGEAHYVARPGGAWEVVSVVHPDRDKRIKESLHKVRALWPHPADPDVADAPLFGVLPILADMDWLNRLSRSQSSNRVGMRGLIAVADTMTIPNGGGDETFVDDLNEMIHRPMESPDDTGAAIITGPAESIESSGNGTKGIAWIIPRFPYDEKLDERMEKKIQRLAYGLPIPPEILLGMQAQSRATAFQVEESSYRAHIEPPAVMVAKVARDALSVLLDEGDLTVEPDPTDLLARRHTTQDVLEAFDRQAISFGYLREALAIPESAAPTMDDLAWMQAVAKIRSIEQIITTPTVDPANQAADEAVNASMGDGFVNLRDLPPTFRRLLEVTPRPEDVRTTAELGEALDHIDATLLAELGGATQQAVERAREKLGAAARSKSSRSIPSELSNAEVAQRLDVDGLTALGVNVETTVRGAIGALTTWWDKRARGAQQTVTKLLGEGLDPEFTTQDAEASVARLSDEMGRHVIGTLAAPDAQALPATLRLAIISTAGGADS